MDDPNQVVNVNPTHALTTTANPATKPQQERKAQRTDDTRASIDHNAHSNLDCANAPGFNCLHGCLPRSSHLREESVA